MASDAHVNIGSFVTISIPSFASVNGWVAWKSAREFGVDFANPLPPRVVDHLIALA